MNFAVVFDLDGTLIDTPRGIVDTFLAALKSMNIDFNDASAIRATIGTPLQKAFGGILQAAPDDPQVAHAVKQYQELFKTIVLPRAKELIYPGVAEGLATLKSRGFALAVATSKVLVSAETLLRAAGLRDCFDLVVGADQVKHPKPHPEMGLFIMNQFGISPERAVMVGDTTHDLLMAKDAGMHSIAVTYGIHSVQELRSAEPTRMVDTFDEILDCVRVLSQAEPAVPDISSANKGRQTLAVQSSCFLEKAVVIKQGSDLHDRTERAPDAVPKA